MVLRIVFSVSLFFMVQVPGFSIKAYSNDSIAEEIFKLIYNQQFNQAENLLSNNEKELDAFYADVLKIDLYWWRYNTSKTRIDANNLKSLLKTDDQNGINSDEQKIRELVKKSYLLRYERKRYNFIGVTRIREEINQMLTELKKEDLPIAGDRLKLFELYILMVEYFDTINVFSLFDKSEKRRKPLEAMELYAKEKDLIVGTMAHYFLGRIYQKVERQPGKGKLHFEILTKAFPENSIFREHLKDCSAKY